MPKNPDIKKVLVLGSGPIIIGQEMCIRDRRWTIERSTARKLRKF